MQIQLEPDASDTSTNDAIEVHKYGGSSVATPESIAKIASRLAVARKSGKRLVVVVSAMGKTTNQLLELARGVSQSPDQREMDMLLSAGERISAAVMAMAVRSFGVGAVSLSGDQAGIRTDDNYGAANILELNPERIRSELDRGRVVVVAGFQGSNGAEVTTLGRGGSDTTAVALAAAMKARCDIFSDVDGVYSADPRVVASARRLDQVAYDEMHTLARYGARVLNADAVSLARRHRVPVYARSTFGSALWTEIRHDVSAERNTAHGVAGVTGSEKVVRLSLPESASLSEVSDELEVVAHTRDQRRSAALVSTTNVASVDALESEISTRWPKAKMCRDLGAVALVGDSLGERIDARKKALATLRSHGVKVSGSFTDRHSFACLVPRRALNSCVRALHRAFIDEPVSAAPA